ncbi:zinc-dependent alcohol dehydrogenase family protein [Desulfatirhabdium butyrativorans]|uniref:zinc-dependent alcohol dehydrogenase family protein n=1 Tax=Desulfatirhabdium butyrativorans TaxID=340467 RepID=UPI0004213708|nr:zinc-dependent alcohol dehydrogenase family protein [Desulfatirhabdium butyrativorans]
MKAMVLDRCVDLNRHDSPLRLANVPVPEPGEAELLVRISTCGVCHTELDEIEGRTPPPHFPVIPGHQAVGTIVAKGQKANRYPEGSRVGVGWIYSACGACSHCLSGNDNLCAEFRATGRDVDGGYAEYMKVHEDYAAAIPDSLSDIEAAPMLCAGAIGYRSLRLAQLKAGRTLGLFGFGASAHLVLHLARYIYPQSPIFVFARSSSEQDFAREIGADWAGNFDDTPPSPVDAAIDTTPVWKPILSALRLLSPGGRLVINAIRKENQDRILLADLDYPSQLWMEKEIKSVANVSRSDIEDFLPIAASAGIRPEVQTYTLDQANQALMELKNRRIRGAKVLLMNGSKTHP